jgi:hypothetical protein
MRSTINPSRMLSAVLLVVTGCGPSVPPSVGEPSGCEGGDCRGTLVQPCTRGHEWDVIQIGTDKDDVGVTLGADDECNIYVAGNTRGRIMNSEPSSEPGLQQDIFVARIPSVPLSNDTGYPSAYWLNQLGSQADDAVKELAVSAQGNVFLVGSTGGLMPGEHTLLEGLGFNDIFATKFTPTGVKEWMRQYGSDEEDVGLSVALAPSGEVLVAGTSQADVAMGFEITLDTLAANGTVSDRATYGTDNQDRGEGIAMDSAGSTYVVGSTLGDFGDASRGSTDVYVMRLSSEDRRVVWTSQVGTSDIDAAFDVAADSHGNVYVLAVSFSDLETGRSENDGIQSPFLLKYRSDSDQPVWIKRIGDKRDYTRAMSLALDPAGSVYVAGLTSGLIATNTGASNHGARDAFVAKFDGATGAKTWARQLGSSGNDEASDVIVTKGGDVVITGVTVGDLTGEGQFHGGQDAFIARFRPDQEQ